MSETPKSGDFDSERTADAPSTGIAFAATPSHSIFQQQLGRTLRRQPTEPQLDIATPKTSNTSDLPAGFTTVGDFIQQAGLTPTEVQEALQVSPFAGSMRTGDGAISEEGFPAVVRYLEGEQ